MTRTRLTVQLVLWTIVAGLLVGIWGGLLLIAAGVVHG